MATKIKIILSLVIVHMLSCYTTCKRNCHVQSFSFAITNKIYPDKDSIYVGDSIWMEVDVPTKLLELNSDQEIDYSSAANLGSAIQFLKLGKGNAHTSNATYAAADFKAHLVIGQSVDNSKTPFAAWVKDFLFDEVNGRYRFKVAFIPQAKGDYMIAPGNSLGTFRKHNKCEKAGFDITIADTDQHLYIYQESRPGYEISGYERTHAYFVRVK